MYVIYAIANHGNSVVNLPSSIERVEAQMAVIFAMRAHSLKIKSPINQRAGASKRKEKGEKKNPELLLQRTVK